jgi:hypothetical protein
MNTKDRDDLERLVLMLAQAEDAKTRAKTAEPAREGRTGEEPRKPARA